ncbi:MAG TPA: hypothetical protein VFE48_22390 [Methylomirabilota bacterium]|nr:hypothetical protein [Methylomirabilota bacterium]
MKLLTVAAAARVLNMTPQLLFHRIQRGDLRVARYKPVRVRLGDVVKYARVMPPVRPMKIRSRADAVVDHLAAKLARVSADSTSDL